MAEGIIISHNHPSGNTKPSEHDIQITKKIKDICKLFDMKLLDHLILTDETYLSMADDGLM
jgi:DNA repair protein RadC